MENAAKALKIAGAVLIALILLALVLLVYRKLRDLPRAQEYQREAEQLAEFNKQFEAYNKKMMYGVDVVSCLNKVIDNNKRSEDYVDGIYNITIKVTIKTDVEDELQIYKINSSTGKEVRRSDSDGTINKTLNQLFPEVDKFPFGKIENTVKTSYLVKGEYEYNYTDKSNALYKLSEETINTKDTVNMKKVATNNDDLTDWSKVVWITSAYNFKSKRFKCNKIGYSEEGRVNEIIFEEIK